MTSFKTLILEESNIERLTDKVGTALSNLKIEVVTKNKNKKKALEKILRAFDEFRQVKD
ncbi:MAG: hypothetical protein J7L15_04720 [Clostridiales bacterium]|nr:hypothetical protein [Clostridiales bacterium]